MIEAGSAIYNSSSEAIVTADAKTTAQALFGSGMLALEIALLKKGATFEGSTTEIGNAASIIANTNGTAVLAPAMALDLSAQSALIPTSFVFFTARRGRNQIDGSFDNPRTKRFDDETRSQHSQAAYDKNEISRRVVSETTSRKLAILKNRLKNKGPLSKHEITNLKQIALDESEVLSARVLALRILKSHGKFRSKFISGNLLVEVASEATPDLAYQTHLLLRDISGRSAIRQMYDLRTALFERISKTKGLEGKALRQNFGEVLGQMRVDINKRTLQFALRKGTFADSVYLAKSLNTYMNPKTGIIESVWLKNGPAFNLVNNPTVSSLSKVTFDFDWQAGTIENVVASGTPIRYHYLTGYEGTAYAMRNLAEGIWTYPIRTLFN